MPLPNNIQKFYSALENNIKSQFNYRYIQHVKDIAAFRTKQK